MISAASGGQRARQLSSARLKPDVGPDNYDWADTDEEREQAAAIDRLAGDRDMVRDLREEGFAGPSYDRLAQELVRYGIAVMHAWIRRGTIFEKTALRNRPVPRPPGGRVPDDEAESLTGVVVAEALHHFREEVLLPGQWDPGKGASLTTFFVGQCLNRFPNLYRSWHTQVSGAGLVELDEEVDRAMATSIPDRVVAGRIATEALQRVRNPQARTALLMVADGYTHPQIADHLDTTTKAVERMLAYGRQQATKGRRWSA